MSDIDPDMFLRGQQDCKEGVEHKSGLGESYDRGCSNQYEIDQIMDAMEDMICR